MGTGFLERNDAFIGCRMSRRLERNAYPPHFGCKVHLVVELRSDESSTRYKADLQFILTNIRLNFITGQIILKKRKTPKLTEVCGVCADRATNHCQYGAQIQVCFACRGFFRRMARNKIIPHSRNCNRTSSNMAVGQCQIDAKSRKKCAYCRYRKCRDLGMQPELVMSKDEARDYMDKAARVKKTGIAAKFLPDTKYQQRIR